MFDIDDDYSDRTVITFSYNQYNDEGRKIASVTRTIRDDEAEFLPNILEAFKYFLQGMTFTYVEAVAVETTEGNEITSEDGALI